MQHVVRTLGHNTDRLANGWQRNEGLCPVLAVVVAVATLTARVRVPTGLDDRDVERVRRRGRMHAQQDTG